MRPEDWRPLIEAAASAERKVVRAMTFRRAWDSACRPVHVTCDDEIDYIVKGSQVGRSAVNEQIVGRLANRLGAPVPEICLVELDPELITINREMSHLTPGLAHASRFVDNCIDANWLRYVDVPENRPRYALLAVLYGWVVANERQFFYGTTPPNEVWSFDHDPFFPNGPGWRVEDLMGVGPVDVDEVLDEQCGLTYPEKWQALDSLRSITPEMIAEAVGVVPEGWGGFSGEERLALAGYLWERCEDLTN